MYDILVFMTMAILYGFLPGHFHSLLEARWLVRNTAPHWWHCPLGKLWAFAFPFTVVEALISQIMIKRRQNRNTILVYKIRTTILGCELWGVNYLVDSFTLTYCHHGGPKGTCFPTMLDPGLVGLCSSLSLHNNEVILSFLFYIWGNCGPKVVKSFIWQGVSDRKINWKGVCALKEIAPLVGNKEIPSSGGGSPGKVSQRAEGTGRRPAPGKGLGSMLLKASQ